MPLRFKKQPKTSEGENPEPMHRKVIDASKVLMGAIAVKAVDELSKTIIKRAEKPKGESTRKFTVSNRPTRSFVQAARNVRFWNNNPEFVPKEQGDIRADSSSFLSDKAFGRNSVTVVPGIDWLVSFSVLLVPAAVLLGILAIVFISVPEIVWFWILIIYAVLVALPGAYLGLDATIAALQFGGETIKFGIRGFFGAVKIFFQGLIELTILAFNSIFQSVVEYGVFVVFYITSVTLLFVLIDSLPGPLSVTVLLLLVLIPSLLPAAFVYRYWQIYRFKREFPTKR